VAFLVTTPCQILKADGMEEFVIVDPSEIFSFKLTAQKFERKIDWQV
jgi:hypothetical protein